MKIKLMVLLTVLVGLVACENQEREFEDFGTTAVSFPFQRPARTLILGKYGVGINDNDNNHRFEIGVSLSGVYENKKNRKVHFEVDENLLAEATNVKPLKSDYYSIVTQSPVTIPSGSTKGRITVQLTDEFFADSLSFAALNMVNYVVPLVITDIEDIDTVLSGVATVDNPSRVRDTEWSVVPKDYTLYGIKFINKYHAMYLRRGVDVMTNDSNEVVSTVYRDEYVERDELVMVTITGENSVTMSNIVRRGALSSPGSVEIELTFDDNDNCTVQSFGSDGYNVTGTGQFVEDAGSWGGQDHDAIFIDYTYTDTNNSETHSVQDTLVVRDRNVVFEEFLLELVEE